MEPSPRGPRTNAGSRQPTALCTQILTIDSGEQVRVSYRRAHGAAITKCAACDVYLCTRFLTGERTSCWEKWHTQKRLQRPNNGIAVKDRVIGVRKRVK